MNIFEKASRDKIRFASSRGALMTEQLWDLKLTDLDAIAQEVNAELNAIPNSSFLSKASNTKKPKLDLKLDILKHIIEVKEDAVEKAKADRKNAAQREVLLAALNDKENEELRGLSKEDILKKLEELS